MAEAGVKGGLAAADAAVKGHVVPALARAEKEARGAAATRRVLEQDHDWYRGSDAHWEPHPWAICCIGFEGFIRCPLTRVHGVRWAGAGGCVAEGVASSPACLRTCCTASSGLASRCNRCSHTQPRSHDVLQHEHTRTNICTTPQHAIRQAFPLPRPVPPQTSRRAQAPPSRTFRPRPSCATPSRWWLRPPPPSPRGCGGCVRGCWWDS